MALVVIMGMLIFSGLTFVVEKDANPDEFISLPAALYWAIITMTSVSSFPKGTEKMTKQTILVIIFWDLSLDHRYNTYYRDKLVILEVLNQPTSAIVTCNP